MRLSNVFPVTCAATLVTQPCILLHQVDPVSTVLRRWSVQDVITIA
jgi:hypothetical protein